MNLNSKLTLFLIIITQNQGSDCQVAFKDDSYYIGDPCEDTKTHNVGICKLITDCSELIAKLNEGLHQDQTVCGYQGLLQIVCCIDFDIENTEISNQSISNAINDRFSADYYDLVAPCTIEKTGEVGVIKELRHCEVLFDKSEQGEIIPRICNYEICKDYVCCPINPNRLNQMCSLHDDPRHELHYKASNQIKCTVEQTGAVGIFNFAFLCKTGVTQKTCDYEECRDIVCCPLDRNITYHGYDINYDFAEVVGDRCHDETTNSDGICRLERQCPQSSTQNLTSCGRDHCSRIVCCPEPDVNTLRSSGRSCTNYKKFIYDRVKPLTKLVPPSEKDDSRCYAVSPSGGTAAVPKEFPSMAALGYELTPNEITWNCGGTLISDLYVLTAAHCLFDESVGHVKRVRLGALNLIDRFQSCPEDYGVETTIQHPSYTKRTVYNDIALIRLNRKVHLNAFMVPACLPQSDMEYSNFVATGWGKTSALGTATEHLLKITLAFYNNTECNELYKYSLNRRFSEGIFEDTQICAGSRDSIQDTCPGDSGGPLLVFHNQFYRMHTIVGVTSFGKSCGSIDSPGIYTKVWPYVQWIEDIVWPSK